MSEKKFRYAAKISSEIITNKNLSFGESIFLSTKKCKTELNSNYNLGIILLCTPLIRISLSGTKNFNRDLEKLLSNVSKKDGELFTKAIEFASPAGLKNYTFVISFTLVLFSIAGIPPLAGFFSKFYTKEMLGKN